MLAAKVKNSEAQPAIRFHVAAARTLPLISAEKLAPNKHSTSKMRAAIIHPSKPFHNSER